MKAVVVVHARMGSKRFPGKSLAPLAGCPLIGWPLRRLAPALTCPVVLAVPPGEENEPLVRYADALAHRHRLARLHVYCDPEATSHRWDVAALLLAAARAYQPDVDVVVRIPGDNPLACPELVELLLDYVRTHRRAGFLYSNLQPRDEPWPDGLGAEAYTVPLLASLVELCPDRALRHHPHRYFEQRDKIVQPPVPLWIGDASGYRFDVDTIDDLAVLTPLAAQLRADYDALGFTSAHVMELARQVLTRSR